MTTVELDISDKSGWTEAQWEELHELDSLCFDDPKERNSQGMQVCRAWPLEELKFEASKGLVILQRSSGLLVGALFASKEHGKLHVTSICVHPEFRRQYIATGLLGLAERFARIGNFGSMYLEYREDIKGLAPFYHKFGFTDMKGPTRRTPGDPKLSLKELWRSQKFMIKRF